MKPKHYGVLLLLATLVAQHAAAAPWATMVLVAAAALAPVPRERRWGFTISATCAAALATLISALLDPAAFARPALADVLVPATFVLMALVPERFIRLARPEVLAASLALESLCAGYPRADGVGLLVLLIAVAARPRRPRRAAAARLACAAVAAAIVALPATVFAGPLLKLELQVFAGGMIAASLQLATRRSIRLAACVVLRAQPFAVVTCLVITALSPRQPAVGWSHVVLLVGLTLALSLLTRPFSAARRFLSFVALELAAMGALGAALATHGRWLALLPIPVILAWRHMLARFPLRRTHQPHALDRLARPAPQRVVRRDGTVLRSCHGSTEVTTTVADAVPTWRVVTIPRLGGWLLPGTKAVCVTVTRGHSSSSWWPSLSAALRHHVQQATASVPLAVFAPVPSRIDATLGDPAPDIHIWFGPSVREVATWMAAWLRVHGAVSHAEAMRWLTQLRACLAPMLAHQLPAGRWEIRFHRDDGEVVVLAVRRPKRRHR